MQRLDFVVIAAVWRPLRDFRPARQSHRVGARVPERPAGYPRPLKAQAVTHLHWRSAESPTRADIPHEQPAPLKIRLANLGVVVIPFAGLIVAIIHLWGFALDWEHLVIFAGMYLATAVGVTVGFHRLFTHRSFKTHKPVKAALGVLGSMAVEGPLFQWVAVHRRHHQNSDRDDDPHSPHGHGVGLRGALAGLWHSHMGWMLRVPPENLAKYAPDLRKEKLLRVINRLFFLWAGLGLLIPAALGGLLTMSLTGALLGFIWGGLVRIFVVHHVTWSVNSVCHLWGSRPFRTPDQSRNNAIFGVLGLGEGWHNNHHAFPASARHGLRWWQVDASYWIIWSMSKVHLAWDVRVPAPERVAAKQRAA